jgi:hypothetical protein
MGTMGSTTVVLTVVVVVAVGRGAMTVLGVWVVVMIGARSLEVTVTMGAGAKFDRNIVGLPI